ncbi:hypothetical protein FACS1894184_13530 [Clostridia bacterium]|nr:hypothetical protein FACS1894184_13530 [Clostridia bacterium]
MDVRGPIQGAALPIAAAMLDGTKLVGAVIARRNCGENSSVDYESITDISQHVRDCWLILDVPEGLHRIVAFYTTHNGNGKRDYFNILDHDSVKLLLDRVYEPHYQRYGAELGKMFEAFFSDEPEFGNMPGYEFTARLGEDMRFIPWSDGLKHRLKRRRGEDFIRNLTALWLNCGNATPHIRYAYMDETTKQLAQAFFMQVGDWCQNHGVKYVGHIIEDDNAHG